MYTPKHLKLWTPFSNYIGDNWPNTYSAGFGQSRDSGALERSNFRMAWKALSSVSDRVQVVSENHWAVGWVEWIAIPADDYEALEAADGMVAACEEYPVLNEMDLSELEQEDANETWADCYSVSERLEYIRRNRKQFEFHDLADMLGCVRGQYFAGYASELISR